MLLLLVSEPLNHVSHVPFLQISNRLHVELSEHRCELFLHKLHLPHLVEYGVDELHRLVVIQGVIGSLVQLGPEFINDAIDQFVFSLLVATLVNIAAVHNL